MGLGQESDRDGEVVSWEREVALRGTFIATRSHADSPASQLTTSPSLPLSWPRPIGSKPEPSRTALMSDLQAHTGSQLPTHGPSHAITDHRRRRHALPLHTCSNTAPPKHSPAQSSHGPPFGSRGSRTSAAPLGSFQACRWQRARKERCQRHRCPHTVAHARILRGGAAPETRRASATAGAAPGRPRGRPYVRRAALVAALRELRELKRPNDFIMSGSKGSEQREQQVRNPFATRPLSQRRILQQKAVAQRREERQSR